MAPFRSLRVRLPLQMTTLIAVVLAAFLWTANRAITATVGRAGAERALVVATQLSNLLAQNATRGLTEMQRIAADDDIRRYVRSPTSDRAAVVERRLRPIAVAGQPPILLLSDSGAPILEIAPASPATGAAASLPPPSGVPATLGVGPFKQSGNTVFSEVVVEVQDASPRSDDDVEPPHSRAGFLVIRRVLTVAQNADLVNRLVGTGASVAIGNRSGDFWTDFSGKEMKVPVDASQSRTASYQASDRDTRIGGMSVIDGTPWAVWVEFPERLILAPARTVVSRLALIALGVVVIAAVFVTMISARITRPLIDLTHASEAIAGGQYSTPVETNRQDEIGRLGVAFTAMTEQVARGQRTLEERVQERTASLEDTRALLEQQVEELRKARADLDHFFALSPDMLCIADMNGRFVRVNAAWQDALGWTAEELTAVPFSEFIHPDDAAATATESAQLADGRTTQRFENRYRCKDGSYRVLSWKAAPFPQRGLVYAAARDVTERRRLARELEDHAAALAAVNNELEAFTYSVSHDLRAPLRHVTGFVALLTRSAGEKLDAEERRRLEVITNAAARMGRLIDDLLAFSRMGRTALVKRRVSLDTLVREARTELAPDPAYNAAKWVIHPLGEIDGDPSMLRLVFVNLLGNALKYSRKQKEPHVEVGLNGTKNGELVVFVKDNGVGFDMQYVDKLFGVFQRLHHGDEFEGTGIGLANVRRIVHRHGGRTWAESAVNQGATFFVALPRADPSTAPR